VDADIVAFNVDSVDDNIVGVDEEFVVTDIIAVDVDFVHDNIVGVDVEFVEADIIAVDVVDDDIGVGDAKRLAK
jgi:hypothetical protein